VILRVACVVVLTLFGSGGGVQAQDGLTSLEPLVELYGANAKTKLGFDVAGIRCAGFYTAQLEWARKHGLRKPSAKEIKDVELHLTRAEIYRKEEGQSVTNAYKSTLDDVQRVIKLYTDHFAKRTAAGQHPWEGDALIHGDSAYCGFLGKGN
jgi:hypothetical protein